MHRSTALFAAAASAGLVAVPLVSALPAQATTSPALVTTATRAANTGAAHLIGAAPAGRQLSLVITLKAPHAAAEGAALRAMYTPGSSTYHRFLTPAQFTARWAATPAAAKAVSTYLSRHGFTKVATLSNRSLLTAQATVAQAESAFHTHIADFRAGRVSFFANTSAAQIPSALGRSVQAVLGLNDLPLNNIHPLKATRQAGSPDIEGGIPPQDFQNTYDAAGTSTGARTSIALLTEGDITQVYKDLRTAEKANKLPQVAVSQINVGPQSPDTAGLDEFDMDSQSSTGMATTVRHLYLYNIGALADAPVDLDFATFVAQDKASAMSASIGGCDLFPYLDGSLVSTDQVEEEASMQGQSIFASSGDNGASCMFLAAVGAPDAPIGTNWPASGEFTTAVGGTSLISDSSGNRIQEIGWLGSGGGFSEVENPGWWTQDTDLAWNNQFVSGGRAVPDVALDADPNVTTPAKIYVNGQVSYVGGTSLSSPLMLGAWARLESAHGNNLGMAAIDLFQIYDHVNPGTVLTTSPLYEVAPSASPSAVAGYTDITLGVNGNYAARPGYDEVTGLGAPDIAGLNKALGKAS
jgi:pseudomonalisin